jgi:hypothetical protein
MEDKPVRRASLKDLLRQRVEDAVKESTAPDDALDAGRLEKLERLARLVELEESVAPKAASRRWPIALAFVLTLGLISALLFVRVPETTIELDVTVSQLNFRIVEPQGLTNALTGLRALGMAGLAVVDVPRSSSQPAISIGAKEGDLAARFATADGQGALTLPPLIWPAATAFTLQREPESATLALGVEYPKGTQGQTPSVGVHGRIDLVVPGRLSKTLNFSTPRKVTLHPRSQSLDLDIELTDGARTSFATPISIDRLSLSQVVEAGATERTRERRASTLIGGKLYFESLGGEVRTLRTGEWLRCSSVHGEIRSLKLDDDAIALRFYGRVKGMTTGSDDARRSLMPSVLEWLQARHALELLWGTTIYLIGLLGMFFRWWGRPLWKA